MMRRQQALEAIAPVWETLAVFAFALLLLAANLALAYQFPGFTDDDVLLSDAGVNLYFGLGFTSTAWPGQPPSEFFSGNLPLYPLALAGWLKLFGFGFVQLRSFTYVCGSLAAVMLHQGIRRAGWIQGASMRVLLVVVTFLSAPIFVAYRVCRYDSLQLLLCTILLALWVSRWRAEWKIPALFVVAALTATSGVPVAAFAGILAVAAAFLSGRAGWARSAAVIAGLAGGAVAVTLFYWRMGVLDAVFETLSWTRRLDGGTPELLRAARFSRLVREPLGEPALVAICAALLVPLTQRTLRGDPAVRRATIAALAILAAVMLGLESLGHFMRYYHWMALLLVAVFAFRLWDRYGAALTPWRQRAVLACFALVVASGFPQRMGRTLLIRPYAAEYHAMSEMMRRELRPSDVLFSEYHGYPVVKGRCAQVYFPGYLERLTPAEEATLTVLAIRERHPRTWYTATHGEYLQRFSRNGAQWRKVAAVPVIRTPFFAWLATFRPATVEATETNGNFYELSLFRRVQ